VPEDEALLVSLEQVRRTYLLDVLKACDWNRARAAKVLGVDRKTVYRMMTRFELGSLEPRK
jgi:transcriptional regulator of acetoin/glycerol metabolism